MSRTEQNYQSDQTGLQFNSLFEHTGSVRELYISLHFIQNTDTDEHSRSHPLAGAWHVWSCTVAINMYVGMHALRSNTATIWHLAVRPDEKEWRLCVSPPDLPRRNKQFFTDNKSCRALGSWINGFKNTRDRWSFALPVQHKMDLAAG